MTDDRRAHDDRDDDTTPGEAGETRSAGSDIWLDAPRERVWRALTDARELERWFPLSADVEPGEGGSVRMSWNNEFEGDAKIDLWKPPEHLRTEWTWGGSVTDYVLEEEDGGTRLRVVTSGFPPGAEWDDWVEGTRRGWIFELASLKAYLEGHDGENRDTVYLRRLVPASMEEVWRRLAPTGLTKPVWKEGGVIDEEPPAQIAGAVTEPVDGLFRVSAQPAHGRPDLIDVTLWLQAWGVRRAGLDRVREEWSAVLEDTFPEGSPPPVPEGDLPPMPEVESSAS